MITSHINSLIFWGAENSYFMEPRKAATVHQIWKLGHLFRLPCGKVDVNIQLENVSTAPSVRKEIRSHDYDSMFFQSTFSSWHFCFFLSCFLFLLQILALQSANWFQWWSLFDNRPFHIFSQYCYYWRQRFAPHRSQLPPCFFLCAIMCKESCKWLGKSRPQIHHYVTFILLRYKWL